MSRLHGTCSNCGALIVEPPVWFSITPWVPSCDRCGATKKLPVIEMEAPKQVPVGWGKMSKKDQPE